MSDIRYKWNDGLNSVQISSDVSLPQFKVLGHRQKTIEASLSTGINIFFSSTGKSSSRPFCLQVYLLVINYYQSSSYYIKKDEICSNWHFGLKLDSS